MPPDLESGAPRAAITGVAGYVPARVVTNAELATRLDTSDEWIVTRTGIRERRLAAPGETTSTMGAEAVRRLMAQRGLGADDVGALIVALTLGAVLIRLRGTLGAVEELLNTTNEELKETLPEVRQTIENVNDITSGVNVGLRTGGRGLAAVGRGFSSAAC